MKRKGAYFYVIDAFVAGIIITAAIIIIFSQFISRPTSTQAFYSGEDLLETIDSTPVRSFNNEFVRELIANKTIDDPRRSVLQQLALFSYRESTKVYAKNISMIFCASRPQNVGMEILIDKRLMCTTAVPSQQNANTRMSAKRIVVLRPDPTTSAVIMIEVHTWQ